MNNVDIYDDTMATTEVPFDTNFYADNIFGGFKNSDFYDYFTLFVAILFIVFCIRIFGMFFSK